MYFTDEPPHVTQLRDILRRFAAAELARERVRQWDGENRAALVSVVDGLTAAT